MTVEERLDALEKEVQRLKDIEEIKELKGKYFRCLDSKNWDLLETTLSPNVHTEYSNGHLRFDGPQQVTNYFKENMPKTQVTLHQGHTPEFEFESDKVAYGRWYLQDIVMFTEGSDFAGTQLNGSAFYRDKYEKIEGQWLIVETGYMRVYEEVLKRDDTHKFTRNMHQTAKKKMKSKTKK